MGGGKSKMGDFFQGIRCFTKRRLGRILTRFIWANYVNDPMIAVYVMVTSSNKRASASNCGFEKAGKCAGLEHFQREKSYVRQRPLQALASDTD